MSPNWLRYTVTVADFDRLILEGFLEEDDQVELIEGEMVDMSSIGPSHAACVKRLDRLLLRSIGTEATIGIRDPVHIGRWSEPQPRCPC